MNIIIRFFKNLFRKQKKEDEISSEIEFKMTQDSDFDEVFYRKLYPDIDQAVEDGKIVSGRDHFLRNGRKEGRIWSNKRLEKRFKLTANYPKGMFEPVNMKKLYHNSRSAAHLPEDSRSSLLIIIAYLQKEVFFAGYTAFFEDFAPIFRSFDRVILAVENEPFETSLVKPYSEVIEVIGISEMYNLSARPKLIVFLSQHLINHVKNFSPDLKRAIYYCLEFEAGFFPFGAEYVNAERVIAKTPNLIVSTELLKQDILKRGLLKSNRVFVTSPKIHVFDILKEKKKRLFFYFRPERFNSRNLSETIWETIDEFCQTFSGYELFLLGTVDTRISFTRNNNDVYIISKLPYNDYLEVLAGCDVAVAFIYSSHPGVIAFQTAASGIPTVTNVFQYRDERCLRSISENLIPYDPVHDSLLDKIRIGLNMDKGNLSFNEEIYGGCNNQSLKEFLLQIM